MNLLQALLGRGAREEIEAPPEGVTWTQVRPQPSSAVRARRAEADCKIETANGMMRARGGEDYIVDYGGGDRSVVRGDLFDRLYEPLGGGLFRKRTDVILRYFTLNRAVLVQTLEGPQKAEPGDWIMQGLAGELWPVPREKALKKYESI